LKPATVSFGQALPADVLDEAAALAQQSDVLLALGSSLIVTPAASLAGLAKQGGGALVIINLTATPYDGVADVLVREKVGTVLPRVSAALLASQ
jgi:NAD-dependent deacetylase